MSEPRVLKISFVPGVTPGKWIRRWEERMRSVPLEVVPVSEPEQLAKLKALEVELAFVRLPVDKTGLNVIPLYSELPVVVAPKDHEIAVFDEVPVEELAAEYLLQDPELFPEWRDISDEIREGTRKPLPPMASVEESLDLVAAGLGILILPMSVARHFNRKDLRYRPVTGVAESQVGVAWLRPDGPIPDGEGDPVIEEFIGVVRGRSAQSSRQPSIQAKQDAAPKKGRAPKADAASGKPGGKTAGKTAGRSGSGARSARPSSRSGPSKGKGGKGKGRR
ncbi:substrate-binding domain-containing protein [Pseudarthrobacter sp. P1]|uniref:substrate-binding domain-containing protein n=1 Tax=Pseudarthrobacter sp. P1 TaxID=3418418 RepID=UPI003CF9EAEB